MRIKSPLINKMIDKVDDLFTKSSKILPPDKPISRRRVFGYRITQLDVAMAVLTVLMGLGFWWYYGHWSMFAATILVMIGLWLFFC